MKHVADLADVIIPFLLAHLIDGFAPVQNLALIRFEHPDDVLERHALARTGKTDERRHLAFINRQIDAIQYVAVAEGFADAFKFNQRFSFCIHGSSICKLVKNRLKVISYLLLVNSDMAAKRRIKHKNQISGFVISMCYDEQITINA